jgi:hypothetical protein
VPEPRQLVHTEWFDHVLQGLGDSPQTDLLLAEELYRLATYADLVPLAPGCRELRLYQTKELLRRDGQLVRALIYFVIRRDQSVELQHIEVVEEDMTGSTPGTGGV